MKITIMALHLGFGGVEKYIATIANILCEKHQVEIIVTYQIVDQPAFLIDKRVTIHYLTKGMVPNQIAFREALKSKNIFKIMKEGMQACKILYLKKQLNKKAIQQCKSDCIVSTRDFHNELIQKYANDSLIKIATEHNHHNGNQEYINRLLKSLKGFDYLLPISKGLCSFYDRQLQGTNTKVLHIPFCVETVEPYQQPSFVRPVYISVGRLSQEKGCFDLIAVFHLIKKKQSDAILHIVGDGPLMDEMKDKLEVLQLTNDIHMHGFLPQKDINALYAHSSIYLMTSFTESFGFVLLEAMACGLPCIAFDSAQGANEIIKDNENGFLIKDRDKECYAAQAITLFDDQKEMIRISKNARQSSSVYCYENTKKEWLALIDEINKK